MITDGRIVTVFRFCYNELIFDDTVRNRKREKKKLTRNRIGFRGVCYLKEIAQINGGGANSLKLAIIHFQARFRRCVSVSGLLLCVFWGE